MFFFSKIKKKSILTYHDFLMSTVGIFADQIFLQIQKCIIKSKNNPGKSPDHNERAGAAAY
jgi:hypothetical protein